MRFTHDCTGCTALGEFEEFDLYHCMQGGASPTVLARYGDSGEQYLSGLAFADHIPSLGEAARRAAELGLHPSEQHAFDLAEYALLKAEGKS